MYPKPLLLFLETMMRIRSSSLEDESMFSSHQSVLSKLVCRFVFLFFCGKFLSYVADALSFDVNILHYFVLISFCVQWGKALKLGSAKLQNIYIIYISTIYQKCSLCLPCQGMCKTKYYTEYKKHNLKRNEIGIWFKFHSRENYLWLLKCVGTACISLIWHM